MIFNIYFDFILGKFVVHKAIRITAIQSLSNNYGLSCFLCQK